MCEVIFNQSTRQFFSPKAGRFVDFDPAADNAGIFDFSGPGTLAEWMQHLQAKSRAQMLVIVDLADQLRAMGMEWALFALPGAPVTPLPRLQPARLRAPLVFV